MIYNRVIVTLESKKQVKYQMLFVKLASLTYIFKYFTIEGKNRPKR